jgi:hypothetical protein
MGVVCKVCHRIGSVTIAVFALVPMTYAAPQSAVTTWESTTQCFVSHDVHFCTERQLDATTHPLAEAYYHSSHQGKNSEGVAQEIC